MMMLVTAVMHSSACDHHYCASEPVSNKELGLLLANKMSHPAKAHACESLFILRWEAVSHTVSHTVSHSVRSALREHASVRSCSKYSHVDQGANVSHWVIKSWRSDLACLSRPQERLLAHQC